MSERDECAPRMDHVRNMYARIMKPDGTVALWSRRQKEFDRAIAAHDKAFREQIAREIELMAKAELMDKPSAFIAGLMFAASIARGEGSE